MQQKRQVNRTEIISIEEYLRKRKKIREHERRRWHAASQKEREEESPAWIEAELYVQ